MPSSHTTLEGILQVPSKRKRNLVDRSGQVRLRQPRGAYAFCHHTYPYI